MQQFSIKRKKFIEHYLRSGNATEAVKQSGYKWNEKTIGPVASRLLQHPEVKRAREAYISDMRDKTVKADITIEIDNNEVLRRLIEIAYFGSSEKIRGDMLINLAKMSGQFRESINLLVEAKKEYAGLGYGNFAETRIVRPEEESGES